MESGSCEQVLRGHTSPVLCVAVLSDGRVLSGSLERVVRLWDLRPADDGGQRPAVQLRGHADAVRAVGELADGRLFSGSDDGTLRLWAPADGRAEAVLRTHRKSSVLSGAQLPSGRLLTGAADGVLRLWPLPPRGSGATLTEPLRALAATSGGINVIAATSASAASGERALTGSAEGAVRLWNVDSGVCLRVLTGHRGAVTGVGLLAGGLLASVSMDRTLRVWDAEVGSCMAVLSGHLHWINCMVVLPDDRIVTASSDRTLRFWRAGKCELVLPHEAPEAAPGMPELPVLVMSPPDVTPLRPAGGAAADEEEEEEECERPRLAPFGGDDEADWAAEVARWNLAEAEEEPGRAPWTGIEDANPATRMLLGATKAAALAGAAAALAFLGRRLLRGGKNAAGAPGSSAAARAQQRAAARAARQKQRAAAAAR